MSGTTGQGGSPDFSPTYIIFEKKCINYFPISAKFRSIRSHFTGLNFNIFSRGYASKLPNGCVIPPARVNPTNRQNVPWSLRATFSTVVDLYSLFVSKTYISCKYCLFNKGNFLLILYIGIVHYHSLLVILKFLKNSLVHVLFINIAFEIMVLPIC